MRDKNFYQQPSRTEPTPPAPGIDRATNSVAAEAHHAVVRPGNRAHSVLPFWLTPTGLQNAANRLWSEWQSQHFVLPVYRIALGTSAVAFLTALFLQSLVPEGVPFVLFAGVVVSASLGGQRAGWTTVGLCTLAYFWFLLHPAIALSHTFTIVFSLSLFLLVALLTSAFCDGLYTAQQESEAARGQAETLARRSLLLAEASSLLDDLKEPGSTLEPIVELAAQRFGDWCAIDMFQESRLLRVAAAHRKSHQTSLVYRYGPNAQALSGAPPYLAQTLEVGTARLFSEMPSQMLWPTANRREMSPPLSKIHPRSLICVPLITQGHVTGALTLASENPDRHYTSLDLEVAQELAARIALATENTRLYHAAQQELEERKRAEERVQVLNDQLQLAMTETHHRVKNNLQLISAMLDMRLMDGAETFPAEELQRISSSVRTLAIVHDLLTHAAKKDGTAHTVSVQGVLNQLLSMMRQSTDKTHLLYEVEELTLSTKQCTSLALITNELVSNAIKHGNGEVRVSFTVDSQNGMLDVYDNGRGFPQGFDALQAANTGLELVENLSRLDLRGSTLYQTAPAGGGHVRVTLPLTYTNGA